MINIDEENKVVTYENEPNATRQLFPNIPLTVDVSPLEEEIESLGERLDTAEDDITDIKGQLLTYNGQPEVTSAAAGMTDQDKIYVYTGSESGYTNGDWYYYNGTAWVSGGTYVANPVQIDDTLTQSGDAADAKVTGDKIAQIKSDFDALETDLTYKSDNKYGGTESAIFITLTNKKGWNGNSGIQNNYNARSASDQIKKTPDMKAISCESGYSMTVTGNNDGAGHAMSTIVATWIASLDLTEVNYKYLFITIKKTDGTDFSDGTTSDVISITRYTETIPYLTETEFAPIEEAIFPEKTFFDYTDKSLVGSYSTRRRWFFDYAIPSGTEISDIIYKSNGTYGTGYLELWEDNSGTLTKKAVYLISSYSGSTHTINVNYKTTGITYIAILTAAQFIGYITSGELNSLASTNVDVDTASIEFSSLSSFSGYTPCISVKYKSFVFEPIITDNVIVIGEGMRYEEVQDALNSIIDDTLSNPYTIIIMPKGTPYKPFSMVRNSWDDSYPWSGISPRNISIIGLDKEHCIIQSDSGDYKKPCGEPMTNGIIKNLTFVMTNDEQDSDATQGGYCLHIDCRTLNDVGYDMSIEDCDFECESGPCLGIGMHENCTLTIKRCNFKTTLSADYAPHEGYRNLYDFGVIFCHTSTRADALKQHIWIEDCVGTCEADTKSLWLAAAGDYSQSTAEFVYTLLKNVFWNNSGNAPGYSISNSLTPDPMNFGNNIPTG